MDIGTGASCIYPLLGCTIRPRWKMAATGRCCDIIGKRKGWLTAVLEIDDTNLTYARENIQRNKVANRIRVFKTKSDGPLIALKEINLQRYEH